MTALLTEAEWAAVALSARIAFWATLISLPFGIATAWLLARREFPGKQLLNGLVHLPLILPPVVTGYGLLILFGRRGPVGAGHREEGGAERQQEKGAEVVFHERWLLSGCQLDWLCRNSRGSICWTLPFLTSRGVALKVRLKAVANAWLLWKPTIMAIWVIFMDDPMSSS